MVPLDANRGRDDIKEISTPGGLALALAGRARKLRGLVLGALVRDGDGGPMRARHARFSQALAAMTRDEFADAYAQTITVGLLSARWLTRDDGRRFTRQELPALVSATSPFLGDLLCDLLDVEFDDELRRSLDELTGLLARTAVERVFAAERDPTIHFYEAFLDEYAPQLRRERGVYYTPDEVVEHMVGTVDGLLRTRLGLRLGLADPTTWSGYAGPRPAGVDGDEFVVQVLDPATGTGTFLLHALRRIFATMRAEYVRLGLDDAAAAAAWAVYVRDVLLPRVHGFELMMAPYTVAHLRLGLALTGGLAAEHGLDAARWGVRFGPHDHLRLYLTNTLELDARAEASLLGAHGIEMARAAARLKQDSHMLVVLGNPPYERISAGTDEAAAWLLRGKVPGRADETSLFDDIRDVAREHTIFSHLRSLSDRYVYFWRWVLWKAFERPAGPGIVALITNATWLAGPGFVGLRKLVRERGDELWIVDLGGDHRGTHPEPNVFNIETPVAITTIVRAAEHSESPAIGYYRKVDGDSARAKLAAIAADGEWQRCDPGWLDSFVPPGGDAAWSTFPALVDLFPWQQPGCLVSRTWPIAPDADTLRRRWQRFVAAPPAERAALFVTARTGRNIHTSVPGLAPLASLERDAEPRPIVRYCLRSFDRQWVFEDPRLQKTESPSLWRGRSDRQIFLCTLTSAAIAAGPALTAAAHVPDFHHFRGSYGGKDVVPLYRDAAAREPNITRGLLAHIGDALGVAAPTPEDLAAYVYALLSAPDYPRRFAAALRTAGPRVPISRDPALWVRGVALGRRLLWLHTYAERCQDAAAGRMAVVDAVPGILWSRPVRRAPLDSGELVYDANLMTLTIGDGVVAGVRADVWAYAVSGMPVVKKWLGWRTAAGAGRARRARHDLDEIRPTAWPAAWSDELLDLLRVLTATLDLHPSQAALLDEILAGPRLSADEMPRPDPDERREPRAAKRSS